MVSLRIFERNIMEKVFYAVCPMCLKSRTLKNRPGVLCNSCRGKETARKVSRIERKSGDRHGILTIISSVKNGRVLKWLCRCDCGREKLISTTHLHENGTKSCGCVHRTQNGLSKHPTYKSWESMIARCYKESLPHFKRYGGRGIKVCDRWRDSYLNFVDDMGLRPKGKSLDRIDCDKNYVKNNCRWATIKEQSRNGRNSIVLNAFGQTKTADDWSLEKKINKSTLMFRINNGWSIEEALTLPVDWRKKSEKGS